MSTPAVSSPVFFLDTFFCIMSFLKPADIFHSAQVCKSWNARINASFWEKLSQKEGIPLVEGKERDRREDFKILYPRTISAKMIAKFFGEVVGPIPPIREEVFNKLKKEDPYENEGLRRNIFISFVRKIIGQSFGQRKTRGQTFIFVVVPHLIRRTTGIDTPLALDGSGKLIVRSSNANETGTAEKQVLEIPFSARNLKILCSYPLSGKENMLVFNKDAISEVFEQCAPCPDRNIVWCMRENVAKETKGKSYAEQKERVEKRGDKVTPFRERALFNAVRILTSGTCPDNRGPEIYARTSDTTRYSRKVYQSVIGGFAPGSGACVSTSNDVYDFLGVVPGVPAEVPQP